MMKKVFAIGICLLSLIFVFAAVGCNAGNDNTALQAAYTQAVDLGYEGTLEEYIALIKGEKGDTGEKGDAGLSAYELYVKYHSDYEGDEEQWMSDLVNGKLADKEIKPLDKTTELLIRLSYLELHNSSGDYSLDEVFILKYYGTYKNNVALSIRILSMLNIPVVWECEIDGITFHDGNEIIVWNNGTFFALKNAYIQGLLTRNDLEYIYRLHEEIWGVV